MRSFSLLGSAARMMCGPAKVAAAVVATPYTKRRRVIKLRRLGMVPPEGCVVGIGAGGGEQSIGVEKATRGARLPEWRVGSVRLEKMNAWRAAARFGRVWRALARVRGFVWKYERRAAEEAQRRKGLGRRRCEDGVADWRDLVAPG